MATVARFLFNLGSMCLSLGLVSLGLVCMVAPGLAAELYGLPVESGRAIAWVEVAGLRDLGLGITAFVLYVCEARTMRYFVLSLLPIVRISTASPCLGPRYVHASTLTSPYCAWAQFC